MSQAKWWPKGETPTLPGIYLSMKDGDGCYWKLPDDFDVLPQRNMDRQFYGPIPEPLELPKPPLTTVRFRAVHKDRGPVTGTFCADALLPGRYACYFRDGEIVDAFFTDGSNLCDVRFLD